MSEHKHPKKPPTYPEVTPEEIKALQTGVLGSFSGITIVRNEPPKSAPPNRAQRRAKK